MVGQSQVAAPHTLEQLTVAHANYVAVFGSGPLSATSLGDGVFYRDSRVRLGDVRDGISATLLVGERAAELGLATWTGAVTRGILRPQRPNAPATQTADSAGFVLGRCSSEAGRSPNSPAGWPEDFGSRHSGGTHFAFADGSVHFLADGTDPVVYAALATRSGGEVVPES